jgi:transcriptional regulator with XRE-family HTH domain
MNNVMTEKVIKAVRARMHEQGITQTELAERLGIERTNLVRMVNGHVGTIPRRWRELLDELGLELIAVPKGTAEKGR